MRVKQRNLKIILGGEFTMKRILSMLLAFILSLSLFGCGNSGESTTEQLSTTAETTSGETTSGETTSGELQNTYSIMAGSSSASGTIIDTIMNYVADQANEQSGGKLEISYHGAGQLGSDSELITECLGHNIPLIMMSTSSLAGVIPEVSLFDMYTAISSTDVAVALFEDEDFKATLDDWFEAAGFKLFLYDPYSFKYIGSTKEINSIDDLKGYDMRVLNNVYHQAFWAAVGANPTTVTISELYLGLQQNLVSGFEMYTSGALNQKMNEVLNYWIDARTMLQISVCVMDMQTWNDIDDADQAWIEEFFGGMQEHLLAISPGENEDALQGFRDSGVTIVEYNQELFQAMHDISEATVYPMVKEAIGAEAFDTFINKIAELES